MYRVVRLLLSAVMLLPAVALAAVQTDAGESAPPVTRAIEPFSSDSLIQLLLGLLLVVGLILLLAWVARRVMGAPVAGRHMRVLSGLPLGTREKAVLVQVGSEQLLLGVAPGRVSLLHRFEEPVVELKPQEGDFAERIREALQGRQGS